MNSNKKDTIVLLHGLLRNKWDMYPLRRFYERLGYPVFNYGYPARKLDLIGHAERLHNALQHEKLVGNLSFVTHSLGSIVVRQFAQLYDEHYSLHRAVFLGPPNQGAAMARMMLKVPFSRALYGPILTELADLNIEEHCGSLEVGVIAGGTRGGHGYSPLIKGNNDGIVAVEETALAGISDFCIVHLPHPVLMFSKNVMQLTQNFIAHGVFKVANEPLTTTEETKP